MTNPAPASPPPTPSEYFIDTPLYEEITFGKGEDKEAMAIFNCKGPIDAYCSGCNSHSIFTRYLAAKAVHTAADWLMMDRFDAAFTCGRNPSHRMIFTTKVDNVKRTMQKIGQYPSLAELSMYDVRKYGGVLAKETFQELKRAIGLAAHGVGIGSFVYLRRIFENLVEEAHQAAKSEAAKLDTGADWDDDTYQTARMTDKIQMLRRHLPDFLVENRVMYGILSKGIHELSEKECLAAFPAVKVGIEIILDAKIEDMERRKKLEGARKSIQALASANKA
ncbi:hypothetical protein [Massilia brevitalea]|uniref:hypothetical protein n=1 Tax=Massilia brevitalea TaxID=442526 RepID=UPI002739CB7E|nr:hypothetical protein [Massilia brevitalea]